MSQKFQNTKSFNNFLSPAYLKPVVNIAEKNFAINGGTWGSSSKSKLSEDPTLDPDYRDEEPSQRQPLRNTFINVENLPKGRLNSMGLTSKIR